MVRLSAVERWRRVCAQLFLVMVACLSLVAPTLAEMGPEVKGGGFNGKLGLTVQKAGKLIAFDL